MNTVRTYWWHGHRNFGDLLSRALLHRFAHLDAVYAEPADAQLVLVGSIIDRLPVTWHGIIAGAGKLHAESHVPLDARILALRGPLSARGVPGNFALADPGLLADELVPDADKVWDLGLIPHWTDTELEHRFARYSPHIIRVGDDPLTVIGEIGQCKKIVSSSLHGIILADAYGIPRRIELAPQMMTPREGGLFKWLDYSASVKMPLVIGETQSPDRNVVIQLQDELVDVFAELRTLFEAAA